MLIVGSAAAATAIAAYFVWFLAKKGRKLWRERRAASFCRATGTLGIPAAKWPRPHGRMRAQPCPKAGSKGIKS